MNGVDLHVHTDRCRHAVGTLADYVDAGRLAGLRTLAFADHMPLPDLEPTDYAMSWDELPAYVRDVSLLRETTEDGLEVLLGIEADWSPDGEQRLREVTEMFDFDVVLGSVHFIDGWAFDDPRLVEQYRAWDPDRLWSRYFEEFSAAAASGLYDVMAHPDLVKKFGCVPEGHLDGWYRDAADALANAGVAVEVNTAGLRKPCAEIYPSLAFLRACRHARVPATTGSDAHRPEEVGQGLDLAEQLLHAAGYRSILVFHRRAPQERAL